MISKNRAKQPSNRVGAKTNKNSNSNRTQILRRFNEGKRYTKINKFKNRCAINSNNIYERVRTLDNEEREEDPLIKHYYTKRKK